MRFPHQLKPGQVGQFVLGNQQIVVTALKRVPAGFPVFSAVNVIAGPAQRKGVKQAKIAVFIHHENADPIIRQALPGGAGWLLAA